MVKMGIEIYSDESGTMDDEIQSIGLLSGKHDSLCLLKETVQYVFKEYGRAGLEYKMLDGDAMKKKCAIKLINTVFKFINDYDIRIDVLTWSKDSSRFYQPGRIIDNLNNFLRMYYHVLSHCGHYWQADFIQFFPDEHSAILWNKDLKPYLNNTYMYKKLLNKGYTKNIFDNNLKNFPIKFIVHELQSTENELIQVIDIITGLTRLSYYDGVQIDWRLKTSGIAKQCGLFEPEEPLSRGKRAKYEVFKEMLHSVKMIDPNISFYTKRYLYTPNPNSKINFWYYKTKSQKDKAPLKANNQLF